MLVTSHIVSTWKSTCHLMPARGISSSFPKTLITAVWKNTHPCLQQMQKSLLQPQTCRDPSLPVISNSFIKLFDSQMADSMCSLISFSLQSSRIPNWAEWIHILCMENFPIITIKRKECWLHSSLPISSNPFNSFYFCSSYRFEMPIWSQLCILSISIRVSRILIKFLSLAQKSIYDEGLAIISNFFIFCHFLSYRLHCRLTSLYAFVYLHISSRLLGISFISFCTI